MCWHAHDPTHERHDPELLARVGDPMLRIYRGLDEATAALLEALPKDAVVLVYSSHGIGPERTASRFFDAILERLDTVSRTAPAGKPPLLDRLAPVYRAVIPAPLRRRLTPSRLLSHAYQKAETDRLRLRRYFAVNPSYATGGVRFNVKGRDADGVVTPGAELDRLAKEVTEGLLAMRNADTGEPLVEHVTATSDLWAGPMRHALPDLLVDWNMSHPIERVTSPEIGEVRTQDRSERSGDHASSKEGVLLFARPADGIHGRQPTINVIDLAPTILRLLDVSNHHLRGRTIPYVGS